MATTDSSDSAVSGGLLVILGIIVALAAAYFIFGMDYRRDTADIRIEADLPRVDSEPDVVIDRPVVDID